MRGAAWNVLGKVVQFLLGLVALTVIARELGPEVYGIYAMGWVLLGLFDIVIAGAPTDALVQRRRASRGHFNVSFWFSLLLACGFASLVAWGAPQLAAVFGGGALLASVLPWRALGLPLRAIAVAPSARLLRHSRFGTIAAVETVASIIASATGVALVFGGAGIWSLVAMELTRTTCVTLALYRLSGWRPGWLMRFTDLRELASFNVSTWFSWGAGYLDGQMPRLIVNQVLGAEAVGYLSLAQRLYETLSDVLVVPVYNVVQAGAARAQQRMDEIRVIVASTLDIGCVLATPLFCGIALLAPLVIPLAFGPGWLAAVPVVQWMILNGIRLPMSVTQGAVVRGLGKPHWDLASALILLVLNASLMWLAAPHGTVAVVIAMLLGNWLIWPLDAAFVRRLTGIGLRAQSRAFLRSLLAGIPMAIVVLGVAVWVPAPWPLAITLQVLAGAVSYGLLTWWLSPALVGQAGERLRRIWRRRAAG